MRYTIWDDVSDILLPSGAKLTPNEVRSNFPIAGSRAVIGWLDDVAYEISALNVIRTYDGPNKGTTDEECVALYEEMRNTPPAVNQVDEQNAATYGAMKILVNKSAASFSDDEALVVAAAFDQYDTETEYSEGALVNYDGDLYRVDGTATVAARTLRTANTPLTPKTDTRFRKLTKEA